MNVLKNYARCSLLLVVTLAVAGLGAGCASSAPEIHHYRLDVTPPAEQAPSGEKPVMGVEQFTADSAYDEDQIVYRQTPYQLNYYYYHRWASTPGLLVTDALRRGYQATGLFGSVLGGELAHADVILSGHISALEEVDVSKKKWVGHLVMELHLRDARTGTLLWSRSFDEREPMTQRSPAGLAQAVSKILTRIVAKSAPIIAQAARQSGAGM